MRLILVRLPDGVLRPAVIYRCDQRGFTEVSESADIELLHRAWEAMSAEGDLSVLEGALDPEAQWRGVEDGQICENRKMVLTVMRRNLHGGLVGQIEETIEV